MPPASALAFSAASNPSASFKFVGAEYSKFCAIMPGLRLQRIGLNQIPDFFGRQRHIDVTHAQRR